MTEEVVLGSKAATLLQEVNNKVDPCQPTTAAAAAGLLNPQQVFPCILHTLLLNTYSSSAVRGMCKWWCVTMPLLHWLMLP